MKPVFFALALFFPPIAASAQVMINQAALDQLAGIPPVTVTAPPEIRQAPSRVTYRPVVHKHVVVKPATTVLASSRAIPKTPVAPPVTPAPQTVPAAPQAQPAVARPVIPKPALPKAPARAAVTFAAGGSDLPPGIIAQLKPFCTDTAPSGPITIDAYAAADPSDPSAAPRLSMARAFALRDALMACGIPSASIVARADGAGKNPNVAQISGAP